LYTWPARNPKKKNKRKKKLIGTKLDLTTIHAQHMERKNVEMHQMMWQKPDFNHYWQSHVPPDMCQTRVNSLF
jgi:hypothetical protein